MSRLAFLTCHLTGTGHLVRTLAVARAAQARGHDVLVISGGRPLDHLDTGGLRLVQLPSVRVHEFEFTRLRQPDGQDVSQAYMAGRAKMLRDTLVEHMPDALITELYPFGRRALAAEFQQAIADAKFANPRTAIFCSVRDIPEPKPRRLTETATRLLKFYDGVLVHGDADLMPLETTWPLPDDLMEMIHHTGYVSVPMPPVLPRRDDVLVAVGGGVLGRRLLKLAAEAAQYSGARWHLLVGGVDASRLVHDLRADSTAENLTIETARPDYRSLLASAGCSISLAGYNTSLELARCTTPAILIPSEEADQQEQLIRARRLSQFPGVHLLRETDLTPRLLADAAAKACAAPPRPMIALTCDDGTAAIETIETVTRQKLAAPV